MSPKTYLTYLEAVVLSLFAERGDEFEFMAVGEHPSFKGYSFSSINVKQEIANQKNARYDME